MVLRISYSMNFLMASFAVQRILSRIRRKESLYRVTLEVTNTYDGSKEFVTT